MNENSDHNLQKSAPGFEISRDPGKTFRETPFDPDQFISDEDPEFTGEIDALGPDPDTGDPRVEIILDSLLARALEASEFLRGVMLYMKLSGRIAATLRGDSIYLNIIGAEPGLVIGHRGQNLDALQHLVNRFVNRSTTDLVPVTVDSDDYRDRRNQQLERMVSEIGSEVLNSGESMITIPLTPSERRLFHIAAGKIKGIRTSSYGEGFFQPIKVTWLHNHHPDPNRTQSPYPDRRATKRKDPRDAGDGNFQDTWNQSRGYETE
ncbi:KH domain-containing protein [bacterium]|nr:KH domain-containing protein [candidate division CSSED10-310 bacterium]